MLEKTLFCALLALAAADDYIDTLDDNFDFSTLDSSQLRDVALCFMNQGPCSDVLYSYKQHYPGVMIDACKSCNKAQKTIANVFFSRVADELPELYADMKKKLDPEDKYFDKYMAALKN